MHLHSYTFCINYQAMETSYNDVDIAESVAEPFDEENLIEFIKCFKSKTVDGVQKYVCRLGVSCATEYTAKSSAIRHLKTHHGKTYDTIKVKKKHKTGEELPNHLELRVQVNVKDILDACAELVIFNSLPLSVLESDAFRKLLQPYAKALALKGIDLTVNSQVIKKAISRKAKQVIDEIKAEAKDKYITLLIDIASRYNRSVLGVNIAYTSNGAFIVRTIGMHTMRMSQSAKNIVDIIKSNLEDFGLNIDRVVAFTTDNGRNMTKTANLFDEMQKQVYNKSLATHQELLDNFDSDEELDDEIFDETYYNDLLDAVANELEIISKCARLVHGVHLIVVHAVNDTPSIKNVLDKARTLVKKLRTPKYRNLLKAEGYNIPTLDVVTRWNTVYDMVIAYGLLFINFHICTTFIIFFFIFVLFFTVGQVEWSQNILRWS